MPSLEMMIFLAHPQTFAEAKEQGISYTLTKHEKGNATIQFKTDKVLQNVDELKKKGVIIDAKIEEVQENDIYVV